MSAISRPTHWRPAKEFLIAVRAGDRGYLYCSGCGGMARSRIDFADEAGVTPNHLNRWLTGKPIPQPVADRIRANLLRVEQQITGA